MRATVVVLAMTLLATPASAQSGGTAPAAATGPTMAATRIDSLALARRYTAWFYTGQTDSLWAHQSAEGKQTNTPARLLQTLMEVSGQVGVEEKVIEERFVRRLGKTQYWRTSQFSASGEPFMLRMVLTPQGEFAGFGFNPRSQAPPVDP